MHRTIFVIDNAIDNNNHPLKGGRAFATLTNHNLRITYKNSLSFIDTDRNDLNEIWLNHEQGWVNVNNHNLRHELYNKLNHNYQQVLTYFKQQLKDQNAIYEQNRKYESIKTFKQFQRNKKICGDWIVSASREWFIANKVILPEGKRKFKVINQQKLKTWANVAVDWSRQELKKIYHPQAFIAAYLHLDESNVHLHIQHLKYRYHFDKRKQKEVYSFSAAPHFTPQYLKTMHVNLEATINERVVQQHHWQHRIQPKLNKRAYLDHYLYKIKSLQEEIAIMEKQYQYLRQRRNQILIKKEQRICKVINKVLKKQYPQLWERCYELLISEGWTKKTIEKLKKDHYSQFRVKFFTKID